MKKLLTIMVLALALCLICSAALATATYEANYTFDSYYDLFVGQEVYDVYGNLWVITDIPKNVKKAGHDDGAQIKVSAVDYWTNSEVCILEIKVKSTHEIEWDEDNSVDPTCSAKGVFALKCKDCSWTKTEAIDKIAHITKAVTKDPTCQAGGRLQTICIVCGEVLSDKLDPANPVAVGHKYTAYDGSAATTFKAPYNDLSYWSVTAPKCNDSTEVQNGTAKVKCAYGCGKVGSTQFTWTEAQIFGTNEYSYSGFMEKFDQHIPATYDGHDWDVAKKIDANCFHGAGDEKWCKRCSKYVLTASTDDSKKGAAKWVVDGNIDCTMDGATVDVYCAICKGSSLGHGVQTATLTFGTANTAKDLLGNTYETTIPCLVSFTWAGSTVEFTATVAHDYTWNETGWDDWDVEKGDYPWNTGAKYPCEVGRIAEYTCPYCLAQSAWLLKDDAPGHKWSQWALYDDGEGLTATKRYERVCSECEKREIKAFGNVPPVIHNSEKEHVWVDDPNFKFTCNEENDVKQVCVCGATRIDKERKVGHVALKTEVVKAATCKETGVTHNTCKNCGLDEYVVTEKTDHTWDKGVVTTPATKEKAGVRTFTCTICGATKTEAEPYVVTAAPKYTLTAGYAGGVVAGKLAHVEDTQEAEAQYVRVTFYIGTYYMATTAEVNADGTYAVEGVGPIDYITVVPTGNSAVNPSEVQRIGEAKEIFVK